MPKSPEELKAIRQATAAKMRAAKAAKNQAKKAAQFLDSQAAAEQHITKHIELVTSVAEKSLEIIKNYKSKPTYAFSIEHEGKALYRVVMHTIKDGVLIEKHKLADGLYAKQAIMKMAHCAIQIELNHIDPKRLQRFEVMPSMGAR